MIPDSELAFGMKTGTGTTSTRTKLQYNQDSSGHRAKPSNQNARHRRLGIASQMTADAESEAVDAEDGKISGRTDADSGEEVYEKADVDSTKQMTKNALRALAIQRSAQLTTFHQNIDTADDRSYRGTETCNAGVYRQTPVGQALLAALADLTRSGRFGTGIVAKRARKEILALFDTIMEEQMGVAGQGIQPNTILNQSKQAAGRGRCSSSSGNVAEHLVSRSAVNPMSTKDVASSLAGGKGFRTPTLQGTLSSYHAHNGLWNLQCTDVTLDTGQRQLQLPRAMLVVHAREDEIKSEKR
jgi:hypothetical protein